MIFSKAMSSPKIIPYSPPRFFKLKSINILRLFHLANHIICVVFLYLDRSFVLVLYSFLIWNVLASFGVSIGFHRLLAHKSFETYKYFEKLCVLLGCFSTGGSPVSWVGIHRLHHAQTDTKKDPHSPFFKGWFKVQFNLWEVQSIPKKYVADLMSDRFLVFLHKNYFKILFFWIFLLLLIDVRVLVYVYSLPAVMSFYSFGFINLLGHQSGYKNFQNTAKNNWFVNLWTAGEGWHNNHHQIPHSYRIGFRWFEWDISASLLEHLHLIKYAKVNNPKKEFLKIYSPESIN